MFRTVMLTCLLLLSCTLAYSGWSEDRSPAALTFVNQSRINTLDPQQMSWTSDMRIALSIWEGLTRHKPDTLQPVGGMAELPPAVSDGGTVYTFQLRRDTCWSNGDSVLAADFVRGWRRAIEPGSAADYAQLLTDHIAGAQEYYEWRRQEIGRLQRLRAPGRAAAHRAALEIHAGQMKQQWQRVGIKAIGESTLQVTLTRPTPYFLEMTLLSVMLPIHHSIEKLRLGQPQLGTDDNGLVVYDSQWTKPGYRAGGYPGLITNGAYRLSDWQFRRRVRLERNPHHYASRHIALQRIDILMYEHPNTAFQAYETGVVDWLTDLGMDYTGDLLQRRLAGQRSDIHLSKAFGTYFYNLNCQDEVLPDGRSSPFVNPLVRKAFSIALDRDALCAHVARKSNPPLLTLIPPGSIPGYPPVAGHPRDPSLARCLLDQAGFADRAAFPEVTILYNTESLHERMAEAVAHQWQRELGVRIRLQGRETKTFGDAKAKHNFQIARASWYGDYLDPTTFLDVFACGNGNNDSGFCDPEYDRLLKSATACPDAGGRLQMLARAESMLVNDLFPLIPIFQYTSVQAYRAHVRGIRPNPRELYPLRDIWTAR